jgi:hypothetical protein
VLLTALLLSAGAYESKVYKCLMENKIMVWIGKISYSIYMWHQFILAFARYAIFEKITPYNAIPLIICILGLSAASYYFIEQPFRNRKRMSTKKVLLFTSSFFVITTSVAAIFYLKGGIIKDVPEFNYVATPVFQFNRMSSRRSINIDYNERIYDYDKPFSNNSKIKVLVVGNSFGRDFCNILLEASFKDSIEISYVFTPDDCKDFKERTQQAAYIFIADNRSELMNIGNATNLCRKFDIDKRKLWCMGIKDFGYSNGIVYNKPRDAGYCNQHTSMKNGMIEFNNELAKEWGDRYINLIEMIIDTQGKVPVFTPNCRFISQDTEHLTIDGAKYFSSLLKNKLSEILFRLKPF